MSLSKSFKAGLSKLLGRKRYERVSVAFRSLKRELPKPANGQSSEPPTLAVDPLRLPFEVHGHHSSWSDLVRRQGSASGNSLLISDLLIGHMEDEEEEEEEASQLSVYRSCLSQFLQPYCLGEAASLISVVNEDGAIVVAQATSLADPEAAAVVGFGASGPVEVDDCWFVTSRLLRVRFRSTVSTVLENCTFRCYQGKPGGEIGLIGQWPLNHGPVGFLDVELLSPYTSLLTVLCDGAGTILAMSSMPFPSLVRNGAHYGELVAFGSCGDNAPLSYMRSLEAYSRKLLRNLRERDTSNALTQIEIDLDRATGMERLFEKSLLDWLTGCLGLRLRAMEKAAESSDQGSSYLRKALEERAGALAGAFKDGIALRLTADSIPSLACLFGECTTDKSAVSSVLCSVDDGRPLEMVTSPGIDASSSSTVGGQFPSVVGGNPIKKIEGEPGLPHILSLRFHEVRNWDEAQLFAPFPLDKPGHELAGANRSAAGTPVSVVLNFNGNEKHLGFTLETLAQQREVSIVEVVIAVAESQAAIARQVAEASSCENIRLEVCADTASQGERLNLASATAVGDLLLLIGSSIVFHNPNSVSALSALAIQPGIGSASCMLVGPREEGKKVGQGVLSSGYAEQALVTRGESTAAYAALDNMPGLLGSQWPVAMNTSRMFMTKAADWKRMGGFAAEHVEGEELGTSFWRNALLEKMAHVVSFALSAGELPQDGEDSPSVPLLRPAGHFSPAASEAALMSVRRQRLVA